jgi:hypothetical protein
MKKIKLTFALLTITMITMSHSFGMCINSSKTCKLINSRPWSKDLGNQCNLMYYHCTETFCDGTVKSTFENKKRCDPIRCEPYEDYNPSLKCCIKNNTKWKAYTEHRYSRNTEGSTSTRLNWIMPIKNLENATNGELVYITKNNKKYCRNSKSNIGEICQMTYQNAKYYCNKVGGKLPSIKKLLNFNYNSNRSMTYSWSTIQIYVKKPSQNSGEELGYQYDPSIQLNFIEKELHRGLWINEYCYEKESNAFNLNGDQIISTCTYIPSDGSFIYGNESLKTAAVMCDME